MIEKLERRLIDFPGASNRARCFTHILNLVVKSIMHQFDVSSARPGPSGVTDERREELMRLAGDIDAEDQELEEEDYEDDPEEPDNSDGWIDEREEMAEEDVDELDDNVQPIRFLLMKVSEYATAVCCTVLANLSPHFFFVDEGERCKQAI
jgi:hypothetical protein